MEDRRRRPNAVTADEDLVSRILKGDGEGPFDRASGLCRVINRLGLADVLANETGRRQFLNDLTFRQYESWSTALNTYLRRASRNRRGYAPPGQPTVQSTIAQDPRNGKQVARTFYIGAQPNDRPGMMRGLLEDARKLPSLRAAATLLGVGRLAIHPYINGNTRAAAVEYGLLVRDYQGGTAEDEEWLRSLMTHGDEGYRLDLHPARAGLCGQYSRFVGRAVLEQAGYKGRPLTGATWPSYERLYKQAPKFLGAATRRHVALAAGESEFNFLTLASVLPHWDGSIQRYATSDRTTGEYVLDAERIVASITRPAQAAILLGLQQGMKTTFVHSIEECFVDGSVEPYGPAQRIIDSYAAQLEQPAMA